MRIKKRHIGFIIGAIIIVAVVVGIVVGVFVADNECVECIEIAPGPSCPVSLD